MVENTTKTYHNMLSLKAAPVFNISCETILNLFIHKHVAIASMCASLFIKWSRQNICYMINNIICVSVLRIQVMSPLRILRYRSIERL